MNGSTEEQPQHYEIMEVIEDPTVLDAVEGVGKFYGAQVVVIAPVGVGEGGPKATAKQMLKVTKGR